eukprot:1136393-Pelagomonas_calceolata.AAC.2
MHALQARPYAQMHTSQHTKPLCMSAQGLQAKWPAKLLSEVATSTCRFPQTRAKWDTADFPEACTIHSILFRICKANPLTTCPAFALANIAN